MIIPESIPDNSPAIDPIEDLQARWEFMRWRLYNAKTDRGSMSCLNLVNLARQALDEAIKREPEA